MIREAAVNGAELIALPEIWNCPYSTDYFEEYSDNFDVLFLMLSTYYRVELFERDTLVIFDEVQAYPRARGLVKYLVADGRYDYIETGSLISIKQNVRDINIPSEEESMRLEPLDFEEFLWAMGESQLFELIRTYFVQRKPIPDFLRRRAMRLLREYVLVTGRNAAFLRAIATTSLDLRKGTSPK